jgi:predicted 3-demethylubiquinone-9 3-methyltransferase (glyoxalase superfamily)
VPRITPFLWFNDNADEAMTFYTSIFPNSTVRNARNGPNGKVMTATIVLDGQELMLLSAGPRHSFTPAVSLFVHCKDQQEVDHYWGRLVEGGREDRCGWLQDRFGLSWQIVPDALGRLLGDKDPGVSGRALQAMLKMTKIDVAALESAARGG